MVAALADPGHDPLEERIASVMGVINAASAELVSLVAEALETGAWEGDGIRSPAHWVALQCGMSSARAAGVVAMARGLATLPECRRLFTNGALSEDQVRAIATRVDAAHDQEMAELAPHCTVSQIRRAVSLLPAPQQQPKSVGADDDAHSDDATTGEPDDPRGEQPGRREVRFGNRIDGRWWCRMVLPAEEGALIQSAIERARDAEFLLRAGGATAADAEDRRRRSAEPADARDPIGRSEVTWADGVARMAEAALSNLDPGRGRPGERYQVYLHVRADDPLSSYLHFGPLVSDDVRRFLTCDATIRFAFEEAGRVVALSEKQDTVDIKTRRIVEDRDRGCVVPGCGQVRWLHIHHLRHREDGGPTSLENLCCLCPYHHRVHHAGLLEIRGDPTRPDGLEFTTSGGRKLGPSPPRPPGAPPRRAARDLGIPDGWFNRPPGERADWRWFWWS